MDVIVEEVYCWGKKVVVYVYGVEVINMVICVGVDLVEYCSFIDVEGLKLVKVCGIYFDFDVYNDDYIFVEYVKFGMLLV